MISPEKGLELAAKLASIILDLVPAPVAQQLINDAAVRRANAVADLAEDAVIAGQKFGGDLK